MAISPHYCSPNGIQFGIPKNSAQQKNQRPHLDIGFFPSEGEDVSFPNTGGTAVSGYALSAIPHTPPAGFRKNGSEDCPVFSTIAHIFGKSQ